MLKTIWRKKRLVGALLLAGLALVAYSVSSDFDMDNHVSR